MISAFPIQIVEYHRVSLLAVVHRSLNLIHRYTVLKLEQWHRGQSKD
ncbi:unnamed protein product [Schistosoma mattheei]|uniref:Uncharacterized protein n=1 Tax=Schistosoma mattheei TaxID=31246 RepID=A0A3P7XWQ9_9TREM|nr:unnamed protein product [Schistosoma mattheei]